MPIRFPSYVQTPAERHDFLLRLQERLRRFNNARVRQIERAQGIKAAVRWHRSWFRPRNTAICQGLLSLRSVLYPKYQFNEDGQVVLPWRTRKLRVRSLRDDASEMLEADLSAIKAEDANADAADPTEDFTTYTEVDPNDRFSIATNTITITGLTRNEDAYVYDDKGADHFGATFEHLLDTQFSSNSDGFSQYIFWAVSNVVSGGMNWYDNQLQAAAAYWYDNPPKMIIRDMESTTTDTSVTLSADTRYYPTVERTGETALECRIYSDSARTTLVDTITVSLPFGRRYRYVFAVNSYNTGGSNANRAASGDVRNLDLQEGGGAVYDGTCEASAGTSAATAANAMVGFATSGAAAVATGGVSGASVAKIAVAPTAGASAAVEGIASAVAKVTSNASASGLSAAGFVYRVLATCRASAGSIMQGTALADALLESAAAVEGSVQAFVLADAVIEACAATGASIEAVAFVLGAVSLSISASATTRTTFAEVIQIIAARTRSTAINKILNAKTLDDLLALNIHRILNAKPGG